MKRRTNAAKRILFAVAILAAIVGAAVCTFLFTAPRFVIVSDAAWSLVMPKREFFRTGLELARRWHRLIVIQPDASVLSNPQDLETFVQGLGDEVGGGAVLFGPLATSKVIEYEVDAAAMLEDVAVYGIYGTKSVLFDATLVPNQESGWTSAAATIADGTSSMPQNVAIVSDSKGSAYNEAIVSQFLDGMVSEYTNEDDSRLFLSNVVQEMNKLGIVLGFCPHLEGFYNVFSMDSTILWVVDYRYSAIVPKKQLYGVVLPDLSGLAKTIPLEKTAIGEDFANANGTINANGKITSNGTIDLEFKYDGK